MRASSLLSSSPLTGLSDLATLDDLGYLLWAPPWMTSFPPDGQSSAKLGWVGTEDLVAPSWCRELQLVCQVRAHARRRVGPEPAAPLHLGLRVSVAGQMNVTMLVAVVGMCCCTANEREQQCKKKHDEAELHVGRRVWINEGEDLTATRKKA